MTEKTRAGRPCYDWKRMPKRRPTFTSAARWLAVPVAVALAAAPLRGDPTPARAPSGAMSSMPNQVTGDEINDAQKAAVERGLDFLSRRQAADGSYGSSGGYGAAAGITALSGLAFMENGNLPGRGKYGDNVKKCVDFICRSQVESGLFTSNGSQGEMYSHGFATLFLGEVYGETADEDIKEHLQRAVRLIEKCQNPEGGWRYQPAPVDADISVTICQVMALRAARDAGIKVEKEVIDKAIGYVRRCQNPDGGFSYTANEGGGGSGYARTGAGTASLYYAGVFEGDELKRGLEYLARFSTAHGRINPQEGGNYFYGNYYVCQAMFLAGGKYWKNFYPGLRDELVARQQSGGGWSGEVDEDYCTAMALIILQMPNRYLPVFNGKGPGG